jgi:hypothetical protein
LVPASRDRVSRARELLENPSASIGDVALELLGLFVDARDEVPSEVVDALAKGELTLAASILERDGSDFPMEAALLRYLDGDLEGARKFAEEPMVAADSLEAERRVAFRAVLALQEGRDLQALDAISESTIEWPAWHLLRGFAHAHGRRFVEAARSFLAKGGGTRSNSLLPVELAAAALETAGLPVPEFLQTLIQKGWANDRERLAACAILAETIPAPSTQTNEESASADAPTASAGESSSEVRGPSADEPQSLPPAIGDATQHISALPDSPDLADRDLHSQLHDFHQAVSDVLRLLVETSAGVKDLPTLQKIVRLIEEARGRVLAADQQLRQSLGIDESLPPPLREPDAGSAETLVGYFRSLTIAAGRIVDRRGREIAAQKDTWRRRCADVGYPLPPELDAAATPPELEEAISHLRPGLARHTFSRAIRTGEACPEWARLGPRDRLTIYATLVNTELANSEVAERALTLALPDWEALRSARESAAALVATAVRTLRAAQRPLPRGMWEVLAKLVPGSFDTVIQSLDLASSLRGADLHDVDAPGLYAASEGHSTVPEVARIVALQEARTSTDARRRVELFAGLLELSPDDATLQRDFVLALASARRAAAALLVSLHARNACHATELWQLALQAALEAKLQRNTNAAIAALVVDAAPEWVSSPEEIIALLLLCSAEERSGAFDAWQYQFPDHVRAAKVNYPGMLSLLIKESSGSSMSDSARSPDVTRARELLEEFRSDNAKSTIFASWHGGGERYQAWLRDELEGLLTRTLSGDSQWIGDREFTSDKLLVRAERSGLPRILDHGARAARAMAENQLLRLRELSRLTTINPSLARLIISDRIGSGAPTTTRELERLTRVWSDRAGLAAAVGELLTLEQRA